jgi:hypothetical protein
MVVSLPIRKQSTWKNNGHIANSRKTAWIVSFIASSKRLKIVESGGSQNSCPYPSDTSAQRKPRISTARTRREQRGNEAKVRQRQHTRNGV